MSTVGELTANDLGKWVEVKRGKASMSGTLASVSHEANLIYAASMSDATGSFIVGRVTVTLRVGNWGPAEFSPNDEVVISNPV